MENPVCKAISPDFEIVSGVRYGRADELLSPAYWHWRCSEGLDPSEDFVNRGGTLREEVGFCLLGGFGITMEANKAFYERLRSVGAFAGSRNFTQEEIELLLREPASVNGRQQRYRFPNQRSRRISEAMGNLDYIDLKNPTAVALRSQLLRIEGIGPKTASWIARNWFGADDVAIIDIHVLRAGWLIGLFDRASKLPKDYSQLELRFLEFASALGIRASILDAVIWSDMRIFGSRLALNRMQA